MKSEKVYINGRIVPSKLACVSVFDRGLNYADGVFETMKAKEGRVFLLKEHLKRLKRGAEILNIPSPPFGEMEKAIKKLLKNKELRDRLVAEGILQSQKFTWEKTSRATVNVYKKILGIKEY